MHAHAYTDSPNEAKNNEKLKYLSTKELAKFCRIMHIFCICFKKNVLLHPISDNIEYVI